MAAAPLPEGMPKLANTIASRLAAIIKSGVFDDNAEFTGKLQRLLVIYGKLALGKLDEVAPEDREYLIKQGTRKQQIITRERYKAVAPLILALDDMETFVRGSAEALSAAPAVSAIPDASGATDRWIRERLGLAASKPGGTAR